MSIIRGYSNTGFPIGAFEGNRAVNVQYYEESNKKLGTQWEASRRIVAVASGQKLYSLIKTGSVYPVDLKSRVLGYTGEGLIGRMYIMPEGSNLRSGLSEDPVHNMRGSGGTRDFELYAIPTPPNLTGIPTWGADIISEGSTSNQSKGESPKSLGSNRILDLLDREYVMEIESLDVQNITARIEMYNGPIDLPRGAPYASP